MDFQNADAAIFQLFDGDTLQWQERWMFSAEYLTQKLGIVLQDYNILLAWAQYLPIQYFDVNTYPPAGQAQPPGGREDYFAHLNFDFTLLDWGRRYRGVQTARMGKALAVQSLAEQRTKYENDWSESRQEYAMAATNRKLAVGALRSAELEQQKADIEYQTGNQSLPALVARKEAVIKARVSLLEAELKEQQAGLKWMHLAGVLEERFMGAPSQSLIHQMD
jgi:outer membrane protein TolC